MPSLKPLRLALFSLRYLHSTLKPNPTPATPFSLHRLSSSSSSSWLSLPGNPLINWPSLPTATQPTPNQNPNPTPEPAPPGSEPNFSRRDFSHIADLFADPSVSPGPALHAELDRSGIEPGLGLLRAVFDHFGSSPKLLHSLFLWSVKRPGFRPDPKLFDAVVDVLAKSREFDSAWTMILDYIDGKDEEEKEEEELVSVGTFAIMIRRYARADSGAGPRSNPPSA